MFWVPLQEVLLSGAGQGFSFGGGGGNSREARTPFRQAALKALGVCDALLCYLSLIF